MHSAVPLLQDYLYYAAQKSPDKIALVSASQPLTYGIIEHRSNTLAQTLTQRGVEKGDRIIIFYDNSPEAVIAFWGILKANAIVSIINPSTKAEKLAWLINDSRAKVVISQHHLFNVLCEALPRTRSVTTLILDDSPLDTRIPTWSGALLSFEAATLDGISTLPPQRCIDIDLASIIYTSGSTGDPKGVMLTHRNMLTAATSITQYLQNTEDDIILNVLPLAFDYGLYQMIMAFRMGARLVLELSFAFPGAILKKVAEEKITGFPGVPTIFSVMAGMKNLHSFDLSSIRYVTNTAAALSLKHIDFLRNTFPQARIYSMYGLTECKRCSYLPPEDLKRKPFSVGIPIPNTELWIVDEQDRRLGPHQVGQLVVRGATVMKGYWEKPEETLKKLQPGPLSGEQVLYTGDLCRMDDDGYFYFVGRMDDIIKSCGEKVSPREVENILYNLPGIRDAAVIGVEDELTDQAIKAFVVLEEGSHLTVQDILLHCMQNLESHMIPQYLEIVPSLPLTSSGKIDKIVLRELSTDRPRKEIGR